MKYLELPLHRHDTEDDVICDKNGNAVIHLPENFDLAAIQIVHAINAHAELMIRLRTLIASLESIDSNIDSYQDAFGGSTHSIVRMIHNDIAIAKETIAKAEGR